MFRNVLVPLDGSRFAETALPLATRLAYDAQAKLHLVRVHEPAGVLAGMGDLGLATREEDVEWRAGEPAYLADLAADYSSRCFGCAGFREIEGVGGPAICEEAGRINADLIVMASHGLGVLARIWLGSTADYLVRHLSIPILLVPDPGPDAPEITAIRRMAVALDLSKASEAILAPVIALAQSSQAHVTLTHIVELELRPASLDDVDPVLEGSARTEAARVEAQAKLDRVAERLRERGVSVATRVTTGINAAGGLLETLSGSRFDLMALTTHGRGGIRRMVLGSVADQVIRHSAKPVLVLRPPIGS